jgi:uncharacterized protein (TIGR02118 family)
MLRRLSILVRKPSQDRREFARAWEHHGTLVKRLPGIRSYQQNHVLEELGHVGAAPPFRIDGIVELRFDSAEAMSVAFSSELARPVKADEPHFLGHGTGYVASADHDTRRSEDGTKLVIVCRGKGDSLARASANLPGLVDSIRDDVVSIIPRPEMAEGPQQAHLFLHLYFENAEATRGAATALRTTDPGVAAFSMVRVRTLTVI